MSDLISRQAVIDFCVSWRRCFTKDDGAEIRAEYTRIIKGVKQLPSVQPRKGKWDCFTEDIDGLSFGIKRCSMCGASKPMKLFHWEDTEINFCPNCGADMRGEHDESIITTQL